MNHNRDNSVPNPPEALPAEFDVELAQVDRLLVRALHQEAPAGLSQRVFEMSVQSLPASDEAPLRLVGEGVVGAAQSDSRRFVFSTWRKYALAASVLLAAGVTLWMTWPNATPVAPHDAPVVSKINFDSSDFNQLVYPTAGDNVESEVAYLFDATEVHSFSDLSGDLRQIVQQLEM